MTTSRPRAAGAAEPGDADAALAAAARGDQAAFAAFYDATAAAVHGTVLRVLRDPAQSEEVVQEVFLEAWRTAARFDPGRGSARGWVVTMAHRRAVDRVRSSQAGSSREERYGVREDAPYDSVSEEVEVLLEHEDVQRALDVLSPVQRQAVDLAYYGGRTHRQIAEDLDLPLGTVKTRLRDALLKLRDAVGVRS
ncbi:ECF RNA polymerase sigma factor SigK [Paenibacillus sp. TRM 82003]|uniref:ECF RNA polymerase sigma factor SigK n=1 Tax=Kineococcus sp. TRM81007 TaxID=2925831 RepID=UPI001F59B60B|nr:ECF RNA polymerase sigma factor SigK [Kineococcus sp. TRM81007]MCI2239809.1 ECF RNA polymerase sigma factor SigK [Kineococcus sp. TRM81007]MCI3925888.1 ECF RNA polymerase sigma factor SigK [Paenibacillus sp. TRM 82003]